MTDTPWTPGPWEFEAGDYEDGMTLRWRTVGWFDCAHNAPLGTPEGDQAEANCRLIAAAPEMAELLEAALEDEPFDGASQWGDDVRTLLSRIRGEA